jgi:hypothetical protein
VDVTVRVSTADQKILEPSQAIALLSSCLKAISRLRHGNWRKSKCAFRNKSCHPNISSRRGFSTGKMSSRSEMTDQKSQRAFRLCLDETRRFGHCKSQRHCLPKPDIADTNFRVKAAEDFSDRSFVSIRISSNRNARFRVIGRFHCAVD